MTRRTEPRRLGIYALDVGQGDATVIIPPENEGDPIVFDCRDDHVVYKCLDDWGRKRIHALIISHLDWDHMAGAEQLLRREDLQIEHVYLSADRNVSDEHEEARGAKALLDHAIAGNKAGKWSLVPVVAYTTPILEGEDWQVELLAPLHRLTLESERRGRWEDPNVMSAVVRVTMNDQIVLIGGDAPLATWAALAGQGQAKARTFRVPHHGGALADGGVPTGWSAQRLYEEVSPKEAIISVGSRNSHGHPLPQWVEPAREHGCRLLCTQVTPRCQEGLLDDAEDRLRQVIEDGVLIEPDWRHARDRYAKERRPFEVPCAGTVVVTIYETQVRVQPTLSKHRKIISGWNGPICQ